VIATTGALVGALGGFVLGLALEARRERATSAERRRAAQVEALFEVQVRLRDLLLTGLKVRFRGGPRAVTNDLREQFLDAASSLTIYAQRVLDDEVRVLVGVASKAIHDLFRETSQGEEEAEGAAQAAANAANDRVGSVLREM